MDLWGIAAGFYSLIVAITRIRLFSGKLNSLFNKTRLEVVTY